MTIKLPREQTEFVTEEGLLSFLFLFPGKAQDSYTAGSKAYKAEIGIHPNSVGPDSPLVKAVTLVAQTFDPQNWSQHVFGPKGRIRLLEQTDRQQSKYPYYQGKYVLTFSAVYNVNTLGMKDANLADPAQRMKFDQALNAKAPGATRFANPANPADIAKIEQINLERVQGGILPYKEADYHKVLLPLAAHEIWAGCYGRIAGRAYWNPNGKPATVNLALSHVLLTRTGERIVGENSPDAAFGAFAPSTELAPQQAAWAPPPQPPAAPGWGSLV